MRRRSLVSDATGAAVAIADGKEKQLAEKDAPIAEQAARIAELEEMIAAGRAAPREGRSE